MNKPNSKQIARIRQLVNSDPEIMRGTPVFKGTRIPVDVVADMLAQGAGLLKSRMGRIPSNEAIDSALSIAVFC